MKESIRILIVEPEKEPQEACVINTLQSFQEAVGGWIETCRPGNHPDDAIIICNEEGKLMGLKPNRKIRDKGGLAKDTIVGAFLIVGNGGENFSSLTDEQVKAYKRLYSLSTGTSHNKMCEDEF